MSMAVTESTGSFIFIFPLSHILLTWPSIRSHYPSIDNRSKRFLEASSSVVADDWETGEAQQEEQLKNKQQQVGILVLRSIFCSFAPQ